MRHAEAMEAVESGIAALGLEAVVQAYLLSAFGVSTLDALGDPELARALLFIAQLERHAAPRHHVPWPPGAFEGEFVCFKGKVTAAGG